MCTIAGVLRAAYYKWLYRTPSFLESEKEDIIKEMKELHEKVNGIYGYRRMALTINRKLGTNYNHKRFYRLMQVAGIQFVIRRKKSPYKRSIPQHIAVNVLNREFTAEQPNEKRVTDVTESKYSDSSQKDT